MSAKMTDYIEIAPGVTRHMAQRQAVYTGTPAAIVAAGLIRAQDLPEHGTCTVNADGTRASTGSNRGKGTAAGKKAIMVSHHGRSTTVQVRVTLSAERIAVIEAARARAADFAIPRLGGGFFYLVPRPIEVHA